MIEKLRNGIKWFPEFKLILHILMDAPHQIL